MIQNKVPLHGVKGNGGHDRMAQPCSPARAQILVRYPNSLVPWALGVYEARQPRLKTQILTTCAATLSPCLPSLSVALGCLLR